MDDFRDALMDVVNQDCRHEVRGRACYSDRALSAWEQAFDLLGLTRPLHFGIATHLLCDEPDCKRWASMGTPRINGKIGGEYRRTCSDHKPEGWPEIG